MKSKNKVHTIIDAFAGKKDVSDEVYDYRINICNTCPLNSKNTGISNLQKIKEKVIGDFCTACGCAVEEKVSQADEECGLSQLGKEPKWFKEKITTYGDRNMNLINTYPYVQSLDIDKDGSNYEIILLQEEVSKEGGFRLESTSKKNIEFIEVKAGCGRCTAVEIKETGAKYIEVKFVLETEGFKAPFYKNIYVKYLYDGIEERTTIRLIVPEKNTQND